MLLDIEERQRYSRHLMLPEVGESGQAKLKSAKVLLIGAGGLGSVSGLYLASAGVGLLGIIDFDRVDVSNLQRQILFRGTDVGKPKALCAAKHLRELNPYITVTPYEERFAIDNARQLVLQFDVVTDGSDDFKTRYLANDACYFANRPLVYGSIYRLEGQLSVFYGERGPCYRCLFPSPPSRKTVPVCQDAGVLNVLPGLIGLMQASIAIKLIVGIGESMMGSLLVLDALT